MKIDPCNIMALLGNGNALSVLSNNELGLEYYDAALKIDPENIFALITKAIFLYACGKSEEALDLYKKVFEVESCENIKKYHSDIFCAIADAYLGLNSPDKAMEYLNMGLELNPTFIRIFADIGKVFNYLNKYDEAISYFDKAIEIRSSKKKLLNPLENYPLTFSGKAVALFKLKKYDEVLDLLDISLEINGSDLYSLYWEYKVLKFFNEDDQAKKYAELLEEFEGDCIKSFKTVGLIYK